MARTFKKVSPFDEYRDKMTAVLAQLPEGWRKHFFVKFKQYDTATAKTYVENVVQLKSSDVGVYQCLVKLLRWYKRETKKKVKV